MISVRLNRGVTSWYQSLLPVGIPLPHSLAEVESSRCKTVLLTWLCVLRAHVAIGWYKDLLFLVYTLGL